MTLYLDDGVTVDETAIECPHDCGNHNETWDTECANDGCRGKLEPTTDEDGNPITVKKRRGVSLQRGDAEHQIYVDKNFNADHMQIIEKANHILDDYERQGFMLTLRQLYYQFVSSDSAFPNTDQSYKRLGGIITDARLAGLISFERIEDRGRQVDSPYLQPNPRSVMDGIHHHYVEDLWANQDVYVEVWVEKDALSSVIERPCNALQVPFMACKGYMSSSAAWAAGQRFKVAGENYKDCVLIHLGDHDPSGIDMTRDNHARLELFSEQGIDIRRIALNRDQVEQYNPPPNPTKLSDSRARDYLAMHGEKSWELDALTPRIIGDLITDEVNSLIDASAWNSSLERQRHNREQIEKVSGNSDAVWDFVGAKFT